MNNAQSNGSINTVAILGGGPVASALAILLARAGVRVAIWHKPKVAPLIVGESLLPASIPILRLLGVEDEVRKFSTLKTGATVNLSDAINFYFFFDELRGLPRYAYNVPRDLFDAALLEAAQKAGAAVYETPAEVTRVAGTDRVELSATTLAEARGYFTKTPDLIVDATGRVRLLSKLLDIPSTVGPREDAALFAHVDSTHLEHGGHIHATRLDHGWSWRIPLPGRVSVGMVIGKEHAAKFGSTKEERFDRLLLQDSVLSKLAGGAKRLTPVMEYTNYQLISSRLVGDGWVLTGDAAGFVDPIFSSGMLVGLDSAVKLADAVLKGTSEAFRNYETKTTLHLQCWNEFVNYFYDGRLFTAFIVGEKMKKNPIVNIMSGHFKKHFTGIFTGSASNSRYSRWLLRMVVSYGLRDENPKELIIR